jgi:hypothetical protein
MTLVRSGGIRMKRQRAALFGCLLASAVLSGCEDCGTPSIAPVELSKGTVGEPYSEELRVPCRDGEWRLSDGELPPGVELDSEGVFSGTPERSGIYVFTVGMVIDASDDQGGTDLSRGYALVIDEAPGGGGAGGEGGGPGEGGQGGDGQGGGGQGGG